MDGPGLRSPVRPATGARLLAGVRRRTRARGRPRRHLLPAQPTRPPDASRGLAGVPGALAVAAAWSWRILVVGALVWFAGRFLAGMPVVWIPVALSLLLAALLKRPTLWLRQHLPRSVAALLVVVVALVLIAGAGYLISRRIAGQSEQLVAQAGDVLRAVRDRVESLPGIGSGSGSVVDRLNNYVQEHGGRLLSGAWTAGQYAAEALTGLVLTFFLTLFMLIDGDRMWSWLVRLLPRRVQQDVNGAGHSAFRVLSGWIGGTAIIALIHGLVIGLTLELLGTPLVFVLAVLVFIGSFVPIVGAFVFGGFAVLVTLVTQGVTSAAILLGVLVAENLLEGHVYQPLIMGRTVRLHPVAILLGLTVGGLLGGVMGAVVAIPLIGAIHAAVKFLTGIEDGDGTPLGDEDRMAPMPPPRLSRAGARRAQATR